MNDKCNSCAEPTKYVTGFWDGAGYKGNNDEYGMSHGVMYACENKSCDIAVKREKELAELFATAKRISEENYRNTVDIKALRQKRLDKRVNMRRAANILGVSASQYSDWENGHKVFPLWAYKRIFEKLEQMEDYQYA